MLRATAALLACASSATALRVYVAAPSMSRTPFAPRMQMVNPENSDLTDEQKSQYMRNAMDGVDGGGWDNDGYLASTKTFPETDDIRMLRQAEAYVKMMTDERQPIKPEVLKEIEELKARMSPDEIAAAEALKQAELTEYKEGKERREAMRTHRAVGKTILDVLPPPGAAPTPAPVTAPPAVVNQGMVSGSSYASLMGATGGAAPAVVLPSLEALVSGFWVFQRVGYEGV